MDHQILRQIPKMDRLLETEAIRTAADGLPRTLVRTALQQELEVLRGELLSGGPMPEEPELTARMVSVIGKAAQYRLRRLVNATGIVLHTNLGRAPLGREIAEHVAQTAAGYSNLEFDLTKGKRGSRYDLVEDLLCRITGAEAAMVVNNNAAAVFLMLNTMAKGKAVAISRGELVEIGGSFRIPDIMAESGAALVEIGTTNKTHPADYRRVLEDGSAEVLLKVHSSNFKVCGFTESVSIEELHAMGDEFQVPVLYDLGAAFLVPSETLGIHEGLSLQKSVAQADVVCCSGDKLFGAGQAGVVLGKKAIIEKMKKNQLARMLRVDKMTLASLEGVLRWYLDPAQAKEKIPVMAMLSASEDALKVRAGDLAEKLCDVCPGWQIEAVPCMDEPGGGSLPMVELPGWGVAVSCGAYSEQKLEQLLRQADVPIVARIWKERLILSLRTIFDEDIPEIVSAFAKIGGME